MSSENIPISSILILVFGILSHSNSKIINFDPNASAYVKSDIIVKSAKLSCDNDETVNLNGTLLSEIPRGFVKSSTIKSISLSNNQITQIPRDAFNEVPRMECLDLSYNRISLSELLNFRHDHLKILIFDHQRTTESDDLLSHDIQFYMSNANFPNVEALSLKRTNYERSSLYSYLFPKLSTIYWDDSYLAYLNFDMTDYFGPYLKVIHLERNNLKNFTVKNLRNVEELYLDENPLEYISIDVNSNLKTLSLAACNIEIKWNIELPTVITLDLSRNRLREILIDTEYNTVFNLENLSLNYNQFTIVPSLEHFTRLRQLSLNYNLIEGINFIDRTNSLKTLHLRGNKITRIDRSAFLNVPALEELDLAENRLSDLPYDWGTSLKMLRYINLSSNQFKSIVNTCIYSFNNLDQIFVGNNYFTTITENEIPYIPDNCTVYVC